MGFSLAARIGGAPRWSVITNRQLFPNQLTAEPYAKSTRRTVLFATIRNRTIRAQFPNLRATTGTGIVATGATEIFPGVAATGQAELTYQDADTGQPVTASLVNFGTASTALTAPDGGMFDTSAPINALAGSILTWKFTGSFPNGAPYASRSIALNMGEAMQVSNSPIALAGDTINNAPNFGSYGPCRIQGPVDIDSVSISADSRGVGLSDTPNDAYGNSGSAPRLFGNRMPVINPAVSGDTAADFAVMGQSRIRLDLLSSGSFKVMCLGINDSYFQGQSAAQLLANNQIIAARAGGDPAAVIWETLDPVTNTDINTVWNAGGEGRRETYNASIAAMPSVYDIAGVLGTPNGFWLNTAYVEPNAPRTHETNIGNAYAVLNGGYDFAFVGSPPILPLI